MDSINETVIFPDRPLFLTHRKRAGNSGTIDLSSANLNGFMPEASSKSGPKTSTFNVQSQPTPVEGATTLSRYRKIKFIDNNVADITKRRSARPRQLKSKRLRSRTDSIKSGSSSQTNVSSDSSIQDDNATDSVEEIVRRPSVAISDAVISSGLTLSNPRSQSCMYSDSMGATMKSIMPQLIGYYLNIIATTVYPLSSYLLFNPMRSHWFPMAMNDELMFHTTLFACVTHMCYMGKNLHRESAELLQRIVRELNRRIVEAGDSTNYTDTTVCAVSCLAMTEVAVGSWDKWKLHIEGMKRMLLLRGGIGTIAEGLRMKIYRADIEGAVESGMPPVLGAPVPTYPPLEVPSQVAQAKANNPFTNKRSILSLCRFVPEVLEVLNDIIGLSSAVNTAMHEGKATIHPGAMDELIVNLQHKLLQSPVEAYGDLNNASRYASLLYLKTLLRSSDLRWISVRLATKLEQAVRFMVPYGYPMPLLCWICYMGMFGSIPGAEQWKWFGNTLITWYTSRRGRQPDWPAIKEELMQIAWIPAVHNESARTQWQLVENIIILGEQVPPAGYFSDTLIIHE